MIGVLLVAASPAFRAGLRSLLSSDAGIRVAAERSRWEDVQDVPGGVDVVITTSTPPGIPNGSSDDLAASVPVLYLSDQPPRLSRRAQMPAVWGALPEETSAEELCAAVRALAQGLVVGTPLLLFSSEDESPEGSPLTEREAEVLRWLARGLANKQIAAELGISEHTVKFHVSSIYTKLNATNRTQAVREGLRNGWIPL